MSYILDALKKSDQERQQNAGPSLQTMQRPHVIARRSTVFNLTVVAIVALICLSATLSWYFYTAAPVKSVAEVIVSQQAIQEVDESVTDRAFAEADSGERGTDVAASDHSNTEAAEANNTEAAEANNTEAAEALLIPDVILQYWELPDPVQQAIPAMTFSFHVYSDNPTRRTIIINNRRMREGSLVSEGLILEEITQEGVIFNWEKQHRFTINVVENW